LARSDDYRPPAEVGAYRVHEVIGRGGMASVFRGEHTLLERPVAIKFMRSEIAASPEARERFVREARLVAKLSHPNIVTLFDFGILPDGTYYQASELVRGSTLRELLRKGSLAPDRALSFARQLALGLACAHELGIVHRDLKPGNIMIADERVKILDFGIAKSMTVGAPSVTRTGIAIGTPGYMSPEQTRGQAITPATDIYSLGVTLYAMLRGSTPFDAKDTDMLLDQQLHDTPTPPGISPQIDDVVVRCLAKHPTQRPSAAEVAAALEGARTPTIPPQLHDDIERSTAKLEPAEPRLARLGFAETANEATTTEPQPRRRTKLIVVLAASALFVGVAGAVALRDKPTEKQQPAPAVVVPAPPPAPEPPAPEPPPVVAEPVPERPVLAEPAKPAVKSATRSRTKPRKPEKPIVDKPADKPADKPIDKPAPDKARTYEKAKY
jgi:eukaryotic-like serine/threonine-protein kinase